MIGIGYATYRIVHFVGIALVFVGFGGRAALLARGAGAGRGESGDPAAPPATHRRWAAVHGVGLFLALLGGMGLLIRIGIPHDFRWPVWVWAKLCVWLTLAFAPALMKRSPVFARWAWALAAAAVGLAAWLAATKPGG